MRTVIARYILRVRPDAHIWTNMKSKETLLYKGIPMDYNSVDTTELETMLACLQRELEDLEETNRLSFHIYFRAYWRSRGKEG